jgi:hypothetical protein
MTSGRRGYELTITSPGGVVRNRSNPHSAENFVIRPAGGLFVVACQGGLTRLQGTAGRVVLLAADS